MHRRGQPSQPTASSPNFLAADINIITFSPTSIHRGCRHRSLSHPFNPRPVELQFLQNPSTPHQVSSVSQSHALALESPITQNLIMNREQEWGFPSLALRVLRVPQVVSSQAELG